jgi:hypothetical protein
MKLFCARLGRGAISMTDQELLYAFGRGTSDLHRNVLVMQSADFVVIRTPESGPNLARVALCCWLST